jgi:two-component system invasion response regulator UvrY
MATINIMIVDDQQLVRLGLVRLLNDIPGFAVTGDAESAEALFDILEQVPAAGYPHVVLMDLRMPGIGGLEATRKLQHRFPQIKVVALTACQAQPIPQRFLESGATAFVTKAAGVEELAHAIKMAVAGKRYLCQQVAQEMALKTMAINEGQGLLSPFECLSPRELQIAMMITSGIKANTMAAQLSLSPKSVHTYRYRLFDKLNISSDMELALLASRHGLIESHDRNPRL